MKNSKIAYAVLFVCIALIFSANAFAQQSKKSKTTIQEIGQLEECAYHYAALADDKHPKLQTVSDKFSGEANKQAKQQGLSDENLNDINNNAVVTFAQKMSKQPSVYSALCKTLSDKYNLGVK